MTESLPIVNCDGCGACCLTMGHPPFFWNQESGSFVDEQWIQLPEPLMQRLNQYLAGLHDDNADMGQPCIWFNLTSRTCNHHSHRPQVCRDFEIGGEACLQTRRRFGLV